MIKTAEESRAAFSAQKQTPRFGVDELLDRIVVDPNVMTGKPVIRGTRIPVELVVRMIARRVPEAEILRDYPRLKLADIQAALMYAAEVVAHEDVFPTFISE